MLGCVPVKHLQKQWVRFCQWVSLQTHDLQNGVLCIYLKNKKIDKDLSKLTWNGLKEAQPKGPNLGPFEHKNK